MAVTWTDELLDGLRLESDPPADEVVASHFEQRPDEPPHRIFRHLVRSGDVPSPARSDALAAYLEDHPPLPAWADPSLMRRGEVVFSRWAPEILTSLLLASLPEAYAAAKGVQVLRLTARLATDTKRRLVETTQMVVDVMTPGGLAVGAMGYADARRVRLMHAAVRYLILHDPLVIRTCDPAERGPHWCDDWGHPVNQEDLLGTLMTFTEVIFESLVKLGVELSDDDAEAYLHAWNIVGHLLGIRPDLLPINRSSAVELTNAVRRRQYTPSQAGQEMASALLTLAEARMRPRAIQRIPRALLRYLVGDRVADILAIPPAGVTGAIFTPLRRVMISMSLKERHDRLLRAIVARVNRLMVEGWLDFERGGERPAFSLPTHLADQWRISPAPAETGSRTAVDAAGGSGTTS